MSKLVVLVRHGEGMHNLTGRFNGLAAQERGEVMPLIPKGRRQIARMALDLYEAVRVERITASPLERTIESAEVIAARFNICVSVDHLLRERGIGRYDGMNATDILGPAESGDLRSEQERLTAWVREYVVTGCELESSDSLQHRMRTVFESIRDGNEQVTVGVTHLDVIRSAVCVALGQSELSLYELRIPYGSATVIDLSRKGSGTVLAVGSTNIGSELAQYLRS